MKTLDERAALLPPILRRRNHAVEFLTRSYEFAHGKSPRGYGSWAFEFPGSTEELFWFTGTYSEAKRAARDEARRRGWYEVVVCS